MKSITQESVKAFMNAARFKKSNMQVDVLDNVTILRLHGNAIAYLYNDPQRTLSITNCGWFSNTTKERLNAIPGVSIKQKNFNWYLNGSEWNGKLIDVNLI
jgi:hypothetical protein